VLASAAADEEEATMAEYRLKAGQAPKGMGTLGDMMLARTKKKRK
jgi:hypothetical protein